MFLPGPVAKWQNGDSEGLHNAIYKDIGDGDGLYDFRKELNLVHKKWKTVSQSILLPDSVAETPVQLFISVSSTSRSHPTSCQGLLERFTGQHRVSQVLTTIQITLGRPKRPLAEQHACAPCVKSSSLTIFWACRKNKAMANLETCNLT